MAKVVAVIIATKTNAIRRIFVPDNEIELTTYFVDPLETMLVFYDTEFDLTTCKVLIEKATGQPSPDAVCTKIDPVTNKVVDFLMADAEIDTLPNEILATKIAQDIPIGADFDKATKTFNYTVKDQYGVDQPKSVSDPALDVAEPASAELVP